MVHLLFNTASAWDMLLSETAHSILTALLRSSLTVGTNLSLCNFHPQVLILSPGTTQKKPNPSSSFHIVSPSKIWIQLSSLPWLLWEAEYGFPQRRWCPNLQNLSAPARAQPCLSDPMDCSPADSSVHGIFQARILEWITIASSKGSSCISCTGRYILYHWTTWKPKTYQRRDSEDAIKDLEMERLSWIILVNPV